MMYHVLATVVEPQTDRRPVSTCRGDKPKPVRIREVAAPSQVCRVTDDNETVFPVLWVREIPVSVPGVSHLRRPRRKFSELERHREVRRHTRE